MQNKAVLTPSEKIWHYCFLAICAAIFFFLIAPIIVIIPLSFKPPNLIFSFTEKMLSLDAQGYSLRWYEEFFHSERWLSSIKNSFIIGIAATLLATVIGTVAALGLSSPYMPYRSAIMALLISPMIVPLIITAAAMYFFFSRIGVAQSYLGMILAHTALGIPFVIITVTATLSGFDQWLIRASQNLGANATTTFFKVILPLVSPGIISGALFAFITSFDEVVIAIFITGPQQITIPLQMWSGIREEISPTILAVATLLVLLSIALLTVIELLRRRSERLRGITH